MIEEDPLVPSRRAERDGLVSRLGAPGPALVMVHARRCEGLTVFLRALGRPLGPGVRHLTGRPWESRIPGAGLAVLGGEARADPLTSARAWLARLPDQDLTVVVDDARCVDAVSLQSLVSAVRHHRPTASGWSWA